MCNALFIVPSWIITKTLIPDNCNSEKYKVYCMFLNLAFKNWLKRLLAKIQIKYFGSLIKTNLQDVIIIEFIILKLN